MTSAHSAAWNTRYVELPTGVLLALDEWPAAGPRTVFLHATGFSRGCWRTHAARLAHQSTPTLIDLRGHGASSKPAEPYRWSYFVDDLVSLFETEDWQNVVLCGHSVGGATAIQIAARIPDRIAALVLLEAVVPAASASLHRRDEGSLVERTRHRRSRWPSQRAAADYLRARPPYDSWDSDVFEGWIDTGVVMAAGSEAELACPPWVEASVFAETTRSTARDDLGLVAARTTVVRATGVRGMPSTCDPSVAAEVSNAREVVVEGSGHFLPLEDVDLVVQVVATALADTVSKRRTEKG